MATPVSFYHAYFLPGDSAQSDGPELEAMRLECTGALELRSLADLVGSEEVVTTLAGYEGGDLADGVAVASVFGAGEDPFGPKRAAKAAVVPGLDCHLETTSSLLQENAKLYTKTEILLRVIHSLSLGVSVKESGKGRAPLIESISHGYPTQLLCWATTSADDAHSAASVMEFVGGEWEFAALIVMVGTAGRVKSGSVIMGSAEAVASLEIEGTGLMVLFPPASAAAKTAPFSSQPPVSPVLRSVLGLDIYSSPRGAPSGARGTKRTAREAGADDREATSAARVSDDPVEYDLDSFAAVLPAELLPSGADWHGLQILYSFIVGGLITTVEPDSRRSWYYGRHGDASNLVSSGLAIVYGEDWFAKFSAVASKFARRALLRVANGLRDVSSLASSLSFPESLRVGESDPITTEEGEVPMAHMFERVLVRCTRDLEARAPRPGRALETTESRDARVGMLARALYYDAVAGRSFDLTPFRIWCRAFSPSEYSQDFLNALPVEVGVMGEEDIDAMDHFPRSSPFYVTLARVLRLPSAGHGAAATFIDHAYDSDGEAGDDDDSDEEEEGGDGEEAMDEDKEEQTMWSMFGHPETPYIPSKHSKTSDKHMTFDLSCEDGSYEPVADAFVNFQARASLPEDLSPSVYHAGVGATLDREREELARVALMLSRRGGRTHPVAPVSRHDEYVLY